MRIRNVATVGVFTAVLLVGPLAGAALAHVEVSATPDATQGEAAALTFEVPSEKDLPTIAVEVALPVDTPILGLTVPPIDGWTLSLQTATPPAGLTGPDGQPVTEIVSGVMWTAIGVGIAPEESVNFVIEAGALPAVDRIAFPVLQTYSDGSVVSWAQESADGAAEPDLPAPVLFLAAGSAPVAAPTPSLADSQPPPSLEPSEPLVTSPAVTSAVSSSEAGGSSSPVPASTAVGVDAAEANTDSTTTTVVILAVGAVALLAGGGYAIYRRRSGA